MVRAVDKADAMLTLSISAL